VYQERDPGAGEAPGTADPDRGKPQYVDFDSPLSLLALDGAIGGSRVRVVLEEMLPTEDSLPVRSERGSHVAELAVEIVPVPIEKEARV
jgi:hypothetical protein